MFDCIDVETIAVHLEVGRHSLDHTSATPLRRILIIGAEQLPILHIS